MILFCNFAVLLKKKKKKDKDNTNIFLLYIAVHATSEFHGCSSAWKSHMEAGEEEPGVL